ncbi:MAG TPA: YciI family protein [Actinomycetota bacterium]|nr:YciI family protein [Actinomycetota bacterium]
MRDHGTKDYVFLYSGGSTPQDEQEQARVMKAWTDWFTQIGSALKDGGNPFETGVRTVASDGSVSGGTGTFSGYTVVTADSLDEATAIAKGSPVLQAGGSIIVHETIAM